ncbi:MAG: hypothetical protein JXN62_13330 [Bacteroidales bacterium]|nr:hypothetical protein [Bacteroidales bacterium]
MSGLKEEDKQPHDILLQIVSDYGKEKLADPSLKAMISDLMPVEKKEYIRIFRQAVDDKIGQKLLEIEEEDSAIKAARIISLKNSFKVNNGFNDTALYGFDCFLYALGWIESVSKEDYFLDSPEGLRIVNQQIDLAIIDGILKKEEILSVFLSAEKLGIPEDETAILIREKIKFHKLKPASGKIKSQKNQKEELCSSDWFTESIKGTYTEIFTEEGNEYKGEVFNGLPNGKGVIYYANGAKYEGDFRNGKKHGNGIIKYVNLVTYEGGWENDLPNGRGIYKWPSGRRYKGEFKNGKFHGKGILTDQNGLRYYGIWVEDTLIDEHRKKNEIRIEGYKNIDFDETVIPSSIGVAIIGFIIGIVFCIISQEKITSYLYIPLLWGVISGIVIPGSLYLFSFIFQKDQFSSLTSIIIHSVIYLIINGGIIYRGSLERSHTKPDLLQESSMIVTDTLSVVRPQVDMQSLNKVETFKDVEMIQSSIVRRSKNKANLLSVYNYLNRGKTEKIESLITKNSKLELLLYACRFLRQDRVFTSRKYLPQFKVYETGEFMVTPVFHYIIVNFTLSEPSRKDLDFSIDQLVNSLSPWTIFLGEGRYRDSIPVINGLFEFNYGKDDGLEDLNRASLAKVTVEWLNVRDTPSVEGRIIGKLKSADSGEFYDYGRINEMDFQDYQHVILADRDNDINGFVRCYVIDKRSGKYETGFLSKDFLDIPEYIYF